MITIHLAYVEFEKITVRNTCHSKVRNSIAPMLLPTVPKGDTLFCPRSPLFTCNGNVSIVQDDMDRGFLEGSVAVTALSPEGNILEASDVAINTLSATTTVTIGTSGCPWQTRLMKHGVHSLEGC